MIGKTAKGLRADDVVDAILAIGEHLGGDQPTFAHLHARIDDALSLLYDVFEVFVREITPFFDEGIHDPCLLQEMLIKHPRDFGGEPLHAIAAVILHHVVDAIEDEFRQGRIDDFAVLLFQELREVVVGVRRIFDVDLPDDCDARLPLFGKRDGREGVADHQKILLKLHERRLADLRFELRGEVFFDFLNLTRIGLIGTGLELQVEDHVAILDGGDRLQGERDVKGQGSVFF